MKHLLTILALLCAASLSAQGIVRTVGITYTNGAPTHTPSSQGSEIVYDITNKDYYEYTGSGWNKVGEVVDFISGSAAPNYTPGTFDSRLAINANAELYFYNTSTTAWQKISLNEPLASLTFSNNTAATSARRLQYNDDVGDFVFGGIGGVQLEATQKHVWYVRNAEATTLNAGEVVYAFGTLGNSGRITVKRFLANGSIPSKYVVGIVGASIAAGQDGYVVDFGKIRGINTNAFDEGDILYPSATVAGQLTKTEPAAPNARMPIAFVVTKSATVGAIAVRLNGGGKLADIHDVAITTTPTNGQVLTYNDTTNVWRAVTPAPGITDLTFTGSASPFTLNSSTGTDVTFAQSGIVTLSRNANELTVSATEVDGSVTNEGSLTVLAGTATTSVIRSNTSGSTDVTLSAGTGIGLTEAGNTITVTNSAPDQTVSIAGAGIAVVTGTYPSFTVTATELDGSTTNELQTLTHASDATSHTVTLSDNGGSLKLIQGSNITLTTSNINEVTIAATGGGGGGSTDLSFTGSDSPFTLNSSTGTDVGFASGANIALSRTGDTMTIATALPITLKNTSEPARNTFVATQTFDADTTNWTRGTGWTFNGTQAVATAATGDLTYSAPLTLVAGRSYEVTYSLSNYSTGTIFVRAGTANVTLPSHNVTNNVVLLTVGTITGGFRFTTTTFTGNIDNVTVVEINGTAPVIFQGEDDNSTAKYNGLRMPNSATLAYGGGGSFTTGNNNNFFGSNAGQNNTTGLGNNFFGSSAGLRNTAGNNNNFFGVNAGQNNTTGINNNFFGLNAGVSNTTGGNNNFFGSNAGVSNTTGGNNNFFGSNAGQNNTTGGNNNFFGNGAGSNNTTSGNSNCFGNGAGNVMTGANNNYFGSNAGRSLSSGSDNVAIGANAGFVSGVVAATGSNNVFIGRSTASNITASAAAANVIIGNGIHLPVTSGSNQLAISNLIFGLGASSTGTTIPTGGRVGICLATPTATLHLRAGAAAASGAPLKFESGTNLTTPEAGAMEWNGTNLFLTTSAPTRQTINQGLTGSATLDFGNTNAGESADLTITVTGAADGDVVAIGVPNGSVNANTCYTAWVSAANTVTVRFNNYSGSAVNPASGTFKAFVTKF
jgi:hypothetical protein